MATKPTNKPEWATTDVTLPVSGQDNKIRPEEALRQTGWDREQRIAAEELNWQFNNVYEWVNWAEAEIDAFTTDLGSNYYTKTESDTNYYSKAAADTKFVDATGDSLSGTFTLTGVTFNAVASNVGFTLNGESALTLKENGAVEQSYDGVVKTATTATGLDITGGLTTTTGVDKLTASNNGTAPHYAARAWVHFDGTTGAIDSSGNITSVTRTGTGDYDIVFTNDMVDTNYIVGGSAADAGYTGRTNGLQPYNKTISGFTLTTGRESGADNDTPTDFTETMVVIHR